MICVDKSSHFRLLLALDRKAGRKMKISTKGRYALRVMIDLAEHQNKDYIPLKEIAKHQSISQKYLERRIFLQTS